MVSPFAGKLATADMLENIPRLVTQYFASKPEVCDPLQRVSFGTSGHRGSSLKNSFQEDHIKAIAQAICNYRASIGIDGPLYVGIDTHALSEPAFVSVLEVLAANDVTIMIDAGGGYTPTPAVSLAILEHNRGRQKGLADGIVITPSHNPPSDGGIKYNPPSGGPADTDVTSWIENKANELLASGLAGVRSISYRAARSASGTREFDFLALYVKELSTVINLESIESSGIKAAVDPLGGAGIAYWQRLIAEYRLPIEMRSKQVDPTFSFMYRDHDGKIRMDCSSPYAMAGLVGLKDEFDVAFANDTDFDRHGIVTPSEGLMNPNHFLAVSIDYLFKTRKDWGSEVAVGKTLVSSAIIDRLVARIKRKLVEVPVGFKWFVSGLYDGSLGFAGEESAGASFLRKNGSVWTTDKDGIILALLAAEICATTDKNPSEHYSELTREFGDPVYQRIDAPATAEQKNRLKKLSADKVTANELAGEKILEKVTKASGNGQEIGGLKVVTENGWFAARPSGTEDVYKIYAESFKGSEHLRLIQEEAKSLVDSVIAPQVAKT